MKEKDKQLKEWLVARLSVSLQLPKPELLGLILILFIALYKKNKSFLCLGKPSSKTYFSDFVFDCYT